MPSKRASAIKAAKAREAMADRMEAIERNQALIMAMLEQLTSADDEADPEAVVADDATGDSSEGEDAGKEETASKPAPKKKTTAKK